MRTIGIFLAGVVVGWGVRSTVDSSRDLTVRAIAKGYEIVDRLRRFAAVEREQVEDLFAEGKAFYQARQGLRNRSTTRPTGVNCEAKAA